MATLNPDIFALKVENHELLKTAYDAYLANSRSSHAKTLKRGEGPRRWQENPGSRRELVAPALAPPATQSGATVVSPSVAPATKTSPRSFPGAPRNWRFAKPSASRTRPRPSTPPASLPPARLAKSPQQLHDLKLDGQNILLVVSEKAPELLRATNNLANVKLIRATYLNVFDILNADAVVFSETALDQAANWLLDKEEA